MQSVKVKLLKDKLRKNFRDDFGIQWSDTLLDEIIFEAQREYALHSGCLQSEYECVVGSNGLCELPKDFFQAVRILNADGQVVPIESYRVLADKYGDFRNKTGDKVRSVCLDFNSLDFMRVFPIVPEGTVVGTLFYKRFPRSGMFEINNIDAVEQHALYQMFLLTGKQQAQIAFNSFLDIVHRDQALKIASSNKALSRFGNFY